MHCLNKLSRSRCRLFCIDQSVGHGGVCLQGDRNKIGVDVFVNRLCDQNVGVQLAHVVIPHGITEIGDSTFNRCASLEKAVIPAGVQSIGKSAFSGCKNITSIEIPEGVQSIGNEAFVLCKTMESIKIPDSVTSIGEYAFNYCDGLKSMILPEGSQILKNKVFGEELPEGLHDSIGSLYKHMNDAALTRYVVNKKKWKTLSPELQAELFLSRQSKALTRAYAECISTKKNTEEVGKEILKVLTETAPDKAVSKAAAQFPSLSSKLNQQIRDKLDGGKSGGKAVKAAKKNK